jgi:hypothetical protein
MVKGKQNKFSFLESVKHEEPASTQNTEGSNLEVKPPSHLEQFPPELPATETLDDLPAEILSSPSRKLGRPKGKRSDPDYEQVTTYIKKDTHLAVKLLLLQSSENKDFSELVQTLLEEHLKSQKSENSDF